jgi:hypothetical protein
MKGCSLDAVRNIFGMWHIIEMMMMPGSTYSVVIPF